MSPAPSHPAVGLDNAGKTTILYRLHLGEAVKTVPTIGCNVEQVGPRGRTGALAAPHTCPILPATLPAAVYPARRSRWMAA